MIYQIANKIKFEINLKQFVIADRPCLIFVMQPINNN